MMCCLKKVNQAFQIRKYNVVIKFNSAHSGNFEFLNQQNETEIKEIIKEIKYRANIIVPEFKNEIFT